MRHGVAPLRLCSRILAKKQLWPLQWGNKFHASSSDDSTAAHSKSIFSPLDTFARRHIGPEPDEINKMLREVGSNTLDDFVASVIPSSIRSSKDLKVSPIDGLSETQLIKRLRELASKNKVMRSYIGAGYYGTILPPVIQRTVLECPEWYTSYTPYQPEISQGRLESLLNFQTLVTDLTGMSIANASLLDEGTAAAEAMIMSYSSARTKRKTYLVHNLVHPQTIAVLNSRATGFGINIVVGEMNQAEAIGEDLMGVLIQYPATDGSIANWEEIASRIKGLGGVVTVATDLLALTLLKPPGEWGADIAVGSAQRFGVPMGYGGPHAAFFACKDERKRKIPGRLVGITKDRLGNKGARLALQTREQHIRREKAVSNVCTAQALLANMAAMYAVYHGPKGLKAIAQKVFSLTSILAQALAKQGFKCNNSFFDTLTIEVEDVEAVLSRARDQAINLRKYSESCVGVSLDETVTRKDLLEIYAAITNTTLTEADMEKMASDAGISTEHAAEVASQFKRESPYLQHEIFNSHHSETEMLRYIHHLQSKDLSLAHSMIPLGSCTMKLNGTTQMVPISWPEFNSLHPFVPTDQALGYSELFDELRQDLQDITKFDAISLQPNSGAQGEYTGLRVIRKYLKSKGEEARNICLIPVSAHGTNPASAAMAGLSVVPVKCDGRGILDMTDLESKAEKYKDNLAAIMITYPSTYGVFEKNVKEAIDIVHSHGGQVYMDGANMNALIGLVDNIGADVCHLNLHKTFCIPHGGGGPGMGPIGVKSHLEPFLPMHPLVKTGGSEGIDPVTSAPFGSSSILPISWAYIKLMGGRGLTHATKIALLNANYMAGKLKHHYKIPFLSDTHRCAHEFIVDVRGLKESSNIEAIDIAKRLQDYGFHAPTMSWPVTNTLMIEPTESESFAEIERFCNALISIRAEIAEIEKGAQPIENNVLKNAPHPQHDLLTDKWDRPYSREMAAYPLPYLREAKFWPSVARLDDAYGDINLFCSCEPPEMEAA